MNVKDLLKPEQVLVGLHANDKANLLKKVVECSASAVGVGERLILKALTERERLGSTGVGAGIAIPHARIEGLKNPFGLFVRLDRPIDFAAVDEKPVDLIFAYLTPSDASQGLLSGLACVSRKLRDQVLVRKIRAAQSTSEVYTLLTQTSADLRR